MGCHQPQLGMALRTQKSREEREGCKCHSTVQGDQRHTEDRSGWAASAPSVVVQTPVQFWRTVLREQILENKCRSAALQLPGQHPCFMLCLMESDHWVSAPHWGFWAYWESVSHCWGAAVPSHTLGASLCPSLRAPMATAAAVESPCVRLLVGNSSSGDWWMNCASNTKSGRWRGATLTEAMTK